MPCGTTCADTSIIRKNKKEKNDAFVIVRCFDFLGARFVSGEFFY